MYPRQWPFLPALLNFQLLKLDPPHSVPLSEKHKHLFTALGSGQEYASLVFLSCLIKKKSRPHEPDADIVTPEPVCYTQMRLRTHIIPPPPLPTPDFYWVFMKRMNILPISVSGRKQDHYQIKLFVWPVCLLLIYTTVRANYVCKVVCFRCYLFSVSEIFHHFRNSSYSYSIDTCQSVAYTHCRVINMMWAVCTHLLIHTHIHRWGTYGKPTSS